jgi:hypothetical protein
MLIVILLAFWVAVLSPLAVRRLRDRGNERSIQMFHTEHERLARHPYTVQPAHRLDREDAVGAPSALTVVHADDSSTAYAHDRGWEEWERQVGDDEYSDVTPSRYATAYARAPREGVTMSAHRMTNHERRRMFITRLVGTALALTFFNFFLSISLLTDLTMLAWFAVVAYLALGCYAIYADFLPVEALPFRLPEGRPLATVASLFESRRDEYDVQDEYEDYVDDDEFYDADERWERDHAPRRAFG